ncbi:hypothetical protein PFISCL1PPCAC_18181, partial [Pristionchus fissidentatus]
PFLSPGTVSIPLRRCTSLADVNNWRFRLLDWCRYSSNMHRSAASPHPCIETAPSINKQHAQSKHRSRHGAFRISIKG